MQAKLPQTEFARRRETLMDIIGDEGIAIIPSAPIVTRNRDVDYPYRQDSYFYYLTGFSEPDALAVLLPGRKQGEYLLFCRESDAEQEAWHGRRAGLEGACEQYHANDAFPITDIDDIVPGLMESCHRLYYAMGCYPEFDELIMDWMNMLRSKAREGTRPPDDVINLDHIINELRLFKSPAELDIMRYSAQIAMQAHRRAMRLCQAGVTEFQLAADICHEFHRHGADIAYPPIVGGGENGCILHYTENQDVLNDGDLVLIDAGAEYDLYASDITRTYPVNGRFTPAQREIYQIVLDAQTAAINAAHIGNTWIDPHHAATRCITAGLLELGLLFGKLDILLEEEAYKRFFMHRTGHWLGMDVHDVGDYKFDDAWRSLEAGMVLTVEPGIYIAAGQEDVPEKYWNIGIRIEDDVLITVNGPEVLTQALIKQPDELEAFINPSL